MLAFCKQPATPAGPAAPERPSAAGAAIGAGAEAPGVGALDLVVAGGTLAGDRFDFAIERRGGEAVALLVVAGRARALRGSARGGARDLRFELAEGLRAVGRVEDGRVRELEVRDPDRKGPVPAVLGEPAPAPDVFEQTYAGTLGPARVRMKLERRGARLGGVYRFPASTDDLRLAGGVSRDRFTLVDPGRARFVGVLVGEVGVLGQWRAADGKRVWDVVLGAGAAYPEPRALVASPGRIVPRETRIDLAPSCAETRIAPVLVDYPDASVERAIDDALDREASLGAPLTKADCAGATEAIPYARDEGYSVEAERPGYVGLALSLSEYTGGAHGDRALRCVVLDLARRAVVRLAAELTPAGRARVSALAVAALEKQSRVAKLTDAGYFRDAPGLDDAELCFASESGAPALRVEFPLYSIAPYVMGMPSVTLEAKDVSGVFRAGSTGAALFP